MIFSIIGLIIIWNYNFMPLWANIVCSVLFGIKIIKRLMELHSKWYEMYFYD